MWTPFYYISKAIFFVVRPFHPTKVLNKEKIIKKGKYIYASNHLSNLDVPLTHAKIGGLRRYIGKKELKKNPFLRLLYTWFGVIFIDRDAPKMSELREILNTINGKIGQILIFPEGTRNKGDSKQMLPVKGGLAIFAAKSGAPVIPVIIYERYKAFRRNYIYIGDPIKITDSACKFPSAEEIARLSARYDLEFARCRVICNDMVENKRWKKKNRLPDGVKSDALIAWEKENNYKPFNEVDSEDNINDESST
ncbi:MAG: 1-acyl-sn-glycerol-3-phosphate acyltransferase [Clostridia bacterium]|nr:1-acyl-sn-glycerol-3-phosphate acyltransferase [Clostridia bacterium]